MNTPEPTLTIFDGPYDDRITTFIDILAFTRDVASLPQRPALLISIEAVLDKLRKCQADLDKKRVEKTTLYDACMTCFSDNVVLSYKLEPGAAHRALEHAAFIGQLLLRGGYLPRGAITVGKLVHTERIIFGEGLIYAADEEKNRVITPRIKLMPPFHDLIRYEYAQTSQNKHEFVRDRGDGPFVHILGNCWRFLEQEKQKDAEMGVGGDPIADMYDEIKQTLPIRCEDAPDDRARSKIRWMRDYVNDTINEQNRSTHYKVILPGDPE